MRLWVFLVLLMWAVPAEAGYDPLALSGGAVQVLDQVVYDAARAREIPLRIYLPAGLSAGAGPAPVILFSHGLGGARTNNGYLGQHWAGRGYVAVFLQHPGSDESVWKDKNKLSAWLAMKKAANGQNLKLRIGDVHAVLDQLAVWSRTPGQLLFGRMDLQHVGMSGHSFGAVTTEAVSGEVYPGVGAWAADERIDAALVMSPSVPKRSDAKAAFGSVALPWMLMTGTQDTAPIGDADVANRLSVYPPLPAGGKYELVLEGAEHFAFTDGTRGAERRNPAHHRAILALSTAFWDAYLKGDGAARAWLDGEGPAGVLAAADRWQHK